MARGLETLLLAHEHAGQVWSLDTDLAEDGPTCNSRWEFAANACCAQLAACSSQWLCRNSEPADRNKYGSRTRSAILSLVNLWKDTQTVHSAFLCCLS